MQRWPRRRRSGRRRGGGGASSAWSFGGRSEGFRRRRPGSRRASASSRAGSGSGPGGKARVSRSPTRSPGRSVVKLGGHARHLPWGRPARGGGNSSRNASRARANFGTARRPTLSRSARGDVVDRRCRAGTSRLRMRPYSAGSSSSVSRTRSALSRSQQARRAARRPGPSQPRGYGHAFAGVAGTLAQVQQRLGAGDAPRARPTAGRAPGRSPAPTSRGGQEGLLHHVGDGRLSAAPDAAEEPRDGAPDARGVVGRGGAPRRRGSAGPQAGRDRPLGLGRCRGVVHRCPGSVSTSREGLARGAAGGSRNFEILAPGRLCVPGFHPGLCECGPSGLKHRGAETNAMNACESAARKFSRL